MKKIKELQIIPYETVDDDSKEKMLTPTYYYTFHDDNDTKKMNLVHYLKKRIK